MGTRAVIARVNKTIDGNCGFTGVYHHWDGYPSGLGQTLYKLYNGHFNKDAEAMLKFLINDHPAGWSTINSADFNLLAGYLSYDKPRYEKTPDGKEDYERPIPHGPECFCHGDRHEEAQTITDDDASDCGCEWAYAIDAKNKVMYVLSSYNENGSKMIGAFGMGNPNATWKIVAKVDLEGKEPDWESIGNDD